MALPLSLVECILEHCSFDVVRKVEQNNRSTMPVVVNREVLGLDNSDLPSHRILLQMIQSNAHRTDL